MLVWVGFGVCGFLFGSVFDCGLFFVFVVFVWHCVLEDCVVVFG